MLQLMDKKLNSAIPDLYPHLNEKEMLEAEENLDRYLTLVLRIFERRESEANAQATRLTPNTGTLSCTPPAPESSA